MRLKTSCFTLLFLIAVAANSQVVAIKQLADSSLFTSRIKGDVVQILRWKDKLGTNHLVLSESADLISKADTSSVGTDCESGCKSKEVYAYHFLNTDSLLWKVLDYERDCGFDLMVAFRKSSIKITDLDKDGIGETWLMYSLGCKSDVSATTLKLIMHQGNQKHIIRGTSQPSRKMTDPELGGKYIPDRSFAALPGVFKTYAKDLWKRNLYDYP